MASLGEYDCFSDEACTTSHDFMVIGGVLCADDCVRRILHDLDGLHPKRPEHWTYEWKYIRDSNMSRYEEFVDLFFEYHQEHCIDFRCIVVDCRRLNHARFNDGDGDKGFNKLLYQHLYSHFRAMGDASRFRCFHHRRTSKYKLEDVRGMLNTKAFNSSGRFVQHYTHLSYAPFNERPMLQFADVLIGAVGFAWNNKTGHKAAIAERIRKGAALRTLAAPSPFEKQHFNIWEFELG